MNSEQTGKILITGSSGFVGSCLKKRLQNLGFSTLDLNSAFGGVLEEENFQAFKAEEIVHVFHLAGKTFVPDSWDDPKAFYRTNVLGTENVLEFCRFRKISMTYVSAYIYGIPRELPISEENPPFPNNPYAHSKFLAEQLCEFYSREFNLKVAIARPFNAFGPGQNPIFLIPKIISQALFEKEIRVQDLVPKRDYIYIEDLIDALLAMLNYHGPFSIFNIGSGYSISVNDVINLVQEIIGLKKPVITENLVRKNELPDVIADITVANRVLNWFPKHSIKEGIQKTIAMMKMEKSW